MRYILTNLILLIKVIAFSQITITHENIHDYHDSILVRTIENPGNYDFTESGTNFHWYFKNLEKGDSSFTKFIHPSQTDISYQFTFNPGVSNLARENDGILNSDSFGISLLNGYSYYMLNDNHFAEVGFGAELNGTPLPIPYKTPDVIYSFPLTYNKTYLSTSSYSFNLPTIGSLHQERKRVNTVDGWGEITTPYGTFECLRIKSMVSQKDSISISAIPFPIPAIPSSYIEYIWLSKQEKFPILKVRDNGLIGQTITYIDSTNYFTRLGPAKDSLQIRIYPNPSSKILIVETNQDSFDIDLVDINGRVVWSKQNYKRNKTLIHVDRFNAGIYFIRFKSQYYTETSKIIIH